MPFNRSTNTNKSAQERADSAPLKVGSSNKFPKKSAYFPAKPRSRSPQKSNANNSSNTATARTVKTADAISEQKRENANTNGNDQNQTSPRRDSIFVTPPRNYKEIAADVIRADCMNHGYRIEKTIGEGAYAKVKLAEVLPSKLARNAKLADLVDENGTVHVAIKVIDNKNVPKEFLKKFLPRELGNHVPLPYHNNVVRVHEQFKTTDRYYVVMEYCSKGDLLDLINHRISESCKGIGEDMARTLFTMMVDGVHHIHTNGIVHRDLKCENILLDHTDTIKITDFGFSTRFVPDQSSLLKTSCGSYAYTAPEIIQMKAYDGTKSDTWSLGVILFAMLNGRLPFNDAQLSDLEEDMKMQRLRFERTVSFESMVLVRRILQYSPTSRPNTLEILNDPWLTGKRLIPRQVTKPKWVNPYQANKDEGDLKGATLVGTINPVYYKTTIPERGPEATVTVNHEKNETVVLKSRTGNKKNIWTCGPPVSSRPNTWPRAQQKNIHNPKPPSGRGSRGPRGTSASTRKTTTTVIVKPDMTTKGQSGNGENKTRVSSKTIKLSKWYMEKYMTGKESPKKRDQTGDCGCCKAEEVMAKIVSQYDFSLDTDLHFLDQNEASKPAEAAYEEDEAMYPKVVNNVGDIPCGQQKETRCVSPERKVNSKYETKKPEVAKSLTQACTRGGSPELCSRRSAKLANRKAITTSANKSRETSAKKTTGSPNTPAASKSTDLSRPCLVNYMVNRSTSPAERVKYFRNRLMKLYGNEKAIPDVSELPPLMVQALKPPKSQPVTRETTPSPTRSASCSARPGNTWRSHRVTSGTTKVKPVQRVIVHSAVL